MLLMPSNNHDTHVQALPGLHNNRTSAPQIAHLKRLCQIAVLVQRLVVGPSSASHIRLHNRLPAPHRCVHVVAYHGVGCHRQIPWVDRKRHHKLHPRGQQPTSVRVQDGRPGEGHCRGRQAGDLQCGARALGAAVQTLVSLVKEHGRSRGHLQQVLADPGYSKGVVLHHCDTGRPGPPRPGAKHRDATVFRGPSFVLHTRGLLSNHDVHRKLHGSQLEEHAVKCRLWHGVQDVLQILQAPLLQPSQHNQRLPQPHLDVEKRVGSRRCQQPANCLSLVGHQLPFQSIPDGRPLLAGVARRPPHPVQHNGPQAPQGHHI
mmetsp:Transcript_41366/g.108727  ORF Transcript_41366/g.108727 Transcript_41366/m.108727 type:complete len:317 (-) Transcript_41366:2666-3616(-)